MSKETLHVVCQVLIGSLLLMQPAPVNSHSPSIACRVHVLTCAAAWCDLSHRLVTTQRFKRHSNLKLV